MSWLFSRALVEAFSEGTCSDGKPFAPLSGSPTPHAYLPPDKTTAFSRLSRFGMTFSPLTEDRGEALLTSYLAAFPVRTSASPVREPESTEPAVECGDTWRGSLAKFDPDSRSWRTAQPSLLEDLGESLVIWPRSGMTAGGQCWELPMLGRRTSGIGSGSVPNGETFFHTPNTSGLDGDSNSRKALAKRVSGFLQGFDATDLTSATAQNAKATALVMWPTPRASENDQGRKADGMMDGLSSWKAQGRGATLTTAVLRWPTPDAHMGSGGRTSKSPPTGKRPNGAKQQITLNDAVKWSCATPTARDWKSGKASEATHARNSRPLSEQIGGQLNPTWVEWLMGWPLGWTDLKPLATGKCPSAPPPRGTF